MRPHRYLGVLPGRWLPWLFVALAGPLCVVLALSVPTGEVPDEPAHAARADSLRHGEIFGRRDGAQAGISADPALLESASSFSRQPTPLAAKRLTAERVAALRRLDWGAPAFIAAPNTAVYPPVFYAPAALGLAVARWVGAGPYRALLAARLANVAAFLLLGAAALGVARAGAVVGFVALSLPMTLSLAASVNPDGLLIATAALAAAALTRGSARLWRWLAAIAIAVLGAAKPAYLPLALAMLAGRAGWPRWRDVATVAAVALPGLAWTVFALVTVAVPFARLPYSAGPLWPGPPRLFAATDAAAQFSVLAARPWRAVTLPLAALRADARSLLFAGIGVLGRLDLPLPGWLYKAWLAGGLGAVLADLSGPRARLRPAGAAAIVVGALLSIEAVCLLQYLSWTPVGAAAIEGVQGRYLLPMLPFAGVALAAPPWPDRPWLRALAALAPLFCAAIDLAALPRLVLATYG